MKSPVTLAIRVLFVALALLAIYFGYGGAAFGSRADTSVGEQRWCLYGGLVMLAAGFATVGVAVIGTGGRSLAVCAALAVIEIVAFLCVANFGF